MKLLVFGRSGQVATELRLRLPQGVQATFLGRDTVDLADLAEVEAAIRDCDADIIVNAAAYTAVDRAESEQDLAHRINAEAPGAMARAAAARGIPLIHLSTDYVFDGSGERAWREDDAPAPRSAYGRTKLDGEAAVRAAGGPHAIIRTSWVFSAHGANFVKTMLRLGRERGAVSVVADQVGGPTPAASIADMVCSVARSHASGTAVSGAWHFAGAPDTSWADFARAIFGEAGITAHVTDIPTSDYPTPAVRPLNSRLDCGRILADFGIVRPDWRTGLKEVIAGLNTGAGA